MTTFQIAISLCTVLIPLIAIYLQYRLMNKQLMIQNYAEYTKRYQSIVINFPENINEKDFSYDSLNDEIRNKTMRYMRAYFDLCSEEFFLKSMNLLNKKIWKEWESGMRYAFTKTAFQSAWREIIKDTAFSKGFKEFAENAIQNKLEW